MAPLDTNVIIRFLTNDDPALSPRAHTLFSQLETGAAAASLTEAVLVESVQVLSSKNLYNQPRPTIARHLSNIIRLPGVKLLRKRRYLRALELYVAWPALSFVDVLLAVYAEESPPPTVISFDEGFDRCPGLTRLAP